MSRKVGVVLSGCGVFDGTEIHEAVSFLIALEQAGLSYQCMAPNVTQLDVVDHVQKKPGEGQRSVLAESARIARGHILDLANVDAADYDALCFPGGFGAAKNLCDFAVKGADCTVEPSVQKLLLAAHAAGKPIVLACIAPVIAARVFGTAGMKVKLTIGNDAGTADAIGKMGAEHSECDMTGVCVDAEHKLITTPCYMYDSSPAKVFEGATKAVAELARMLG